MRTNTVTINGEDLKLVKENLGSAFIDSNSRKKNVTFEGWRAAAVKAFLKEIKGTVEKEDDGTTPIYQIEIKRKDENIEGWTWINFAGKPNKNMRESLKALGYRYSAKNDMWYAMSEKLEETNEVLKPYYNL